MRSLAFFLLLAVPAGLLASPAPLPRPDAHKRQARDLRERVRNLSASLREGAFSGAEFPKLNWDDIPALLELASRKDRLASVPSNPISSRSQKRCTEGTAALWLIEGIRQGGNWASLNPVLLSGNLNAPPDQLQDDAVKAYRAWWQKVKGLPRDRAATIDPLADTGLRWY